MSSHCFFKQGIGYNRLTQIRTGDQNFTDTTDDDYLGLYEISSIIKHPKYNRPGKGARNDLALVFTKTKIEFNARTNKIGTFYIKLQFWGGMKSWESENLGFQTFHTFSNLI